MGLIQEPYNTNIRTMYNQQCPSKYNTHPLNMKLKFHYTRKKNTHKTEIPLIRVEKHRTELPLIRGGKIKLIYLKH